MKNVNETCITCNCGSDSCKKTRNFEYSSKDNVSDKMRKEYNFNIAVKAHGCECDCKSKKTAGKKTGFYTAVIDYVSEFGNVNDGLTVADKGRWFNDSFVKDPAMALLVAADVDNVRWKVDPSEIMKDVKYDPKNNEYVLTRIYTTNMNPPTAKQYDKILNGEYEYYKETYYIQILKTELMKDDFRDEAVPLWRKHLDEKLKLL